MENLKKYEKKTKFQTLIFYEDPVLQTMPLKEKTVSGTIYLTGLPALDSNLH